MADMSVSLVIAGGEIALESPGYEPGVLENDIRQRISEEIRDSVKIVDWTHQPGYHYSVRMTADLLELLNNQVEQGASGVAVFCGSDALEEVAYLADLLWVYPQPLIFGATHYAFSAPGSDTAAVLNETLRAALSRECWGQGGLVCCGGELFAASDVSEYANYGRTGFKGIFRGAIGAVVEKSVHLWQAPKRSRIFDTPFTPSRAVEVLHSGLGAGERFLRLTCEQMQKDPTFIDGLVLAGFGGGNVYPAWVSHLRRLARMGLPIVMTSRCSKGCVMEPEPSFEGAFPRLKEFGVMSGGFLTPMQARLKLAVGIAADLRRDWHQNYILGR